MNWAATVKAELLMPDGAYQTRHRRLSIRADDVQGARNKTWNRFCEEVLDSPGDAQYIWSWHCEVSTNDYVSWRGGRERDEHGSPVGSVENFLGDR